MRDRLLVIPLLLVCLAICTVAPDAAAWIDPAPPAGGFTVVQEINREVVLDDGYVTMFDVHYPAAAPPAAGWPVVVLVHGLGGYRLDMRDMARDYAAAGYLSLSFDVRGQGSRRHDPRNAGMGTTLSGVQERRDVKTHIDNIASLYPGIADTARLGMTGSSQGGVHSWAAAAWSGRICDTTDPGFGTYPVFTAVAPGSFTPFRGESCAPGGQALRWQVAVSYAATPGTVVLDPAFVALMEPLIAAEDFEQIQLLCTDPNIDPSGHLATTTVPVLASHAFQDYWVTGRTLIDAYHTLGAGVPKRMLLSTVGHGTPENVSEAGLIAARRRAWFDHFLKGLETGILTGNPFEFSIIPSDPAVHDDLDSRWDRRSAKDWPPAANPPVRLYLDGTGVLQNFEPAAGAPDRVVVQTVAPGYGMAQAIADRFDPLLLEANVPERVIAYESSPVASPITLCGDPVLRLSTTIDPMTGGDVQLTARLLDVPPAGTPRFITAHHYARRFKPGETPPAFLDVTLPPVAWRLEPGHRLRIELSNLSFFNTSLQEQLWNVPYFTDFSVTIHHGQGTSSFIDLPVVADRMTDARLVADRHDVSAATGARIEFLFSTDPDHSGASYTVLGSLAGSAPGFFVNGLPVPLNRDSLFRYLLSNPNSWPFGATRGTIDRNGEAFPFLDLSGGVPAALVGRELSLAGCVHDAGTVLATSHAVTVTALP